MDMDKIIKSLTEDKVKIKEPNVEVLERMDKYSSRNLVKKIYANRYDKVSYIDDIFSKKLSDFINKDYLEERLPDLKKAAEFINKTIDDGDRILGLTDYDADGVISATVIHLMLSEVFGYSNFEILVNKRDYGNGLNNIVRDIALSIYEDTPYSLLMLADHGSSDRENLEYMYKQIKCKMIVADHHLYKDHQVPLGSEILDNDLAFINSQRPDSTMSKNITGATTAYLTLLYAYFIRVGVENISKEVWDKIYYLLTYVGMSTISDCMDLKDVFNRKMVNKAFKTLNSKKVMHNPFWTVMLRNIEKSYFINEITLGFEVIPMLNTPGRIDDPRLSYLLMTSQTEDEAEHYLNKITNLNKKRKKRQDLVLADKTHVTYKSKNLIVMITEDGKDIQGIIANRLIDNHKYKIGIVFAPSPYNPDVLIGSTRANSKQINVVEVFKEVKAQSDIIIEYGGHKSAAGIKIKNDAEAFFNIVSKVIDSKYTIEDDDYIYVDNLIYSNKHLIVSMLDIRDSGPYGIGFDKPTFISDVYLDGFRIINKGPNAYFTGRVKLSNRSSFRIGFFYSIKLHEYDELVEKSKYCKEMRIVYTLSISDYFNFNKVSLNVEKLWLK